jgi:hypothetical protein
MVQVGIVVAWYPVAGMALKVVPAGQIGAAATVVVLYMGLKLVVGAMLYMLPEYGSVVVLYP